MTECSRKQRAFRTGARFNSTSIPLVTGLLCCLMSLNQDAILSASSFDMKVMLE